MTFSAIAAVWNTRAHLNATGLRHRLPRLLPWSMMLAAILTNRGLNGAHASPPSAALPIVPDGFSIELVAGPPLVERPITAAFDDQGRLYVADSSGSNDPVQKQLEERPHRIRRLEDTDGDGHFDRSIVFADRMMFPSGTMFYDGSLYVAAPPSIWKLTDTDNDGVADERTEWFQGKTLTGCANDLHGPYLGPDGWFYWCKGAFAEQTHIVNGREWTTRAAHIFRSRPDGTRFEPVMTGGMDNPVDVAFTTTGERFLSATFLVHPTEGKRDGLIHAIYGGVYGKDHGVLENHPRTGELMPLLTHLGPGAPSGLECYESSVFGEQYRGNLFACQFNLRKVSRHILRPESGSFTTEDSDFVTSENVDFHPTDVLVDADGSLLVIDTGGWYKLCCPTSQLWKPDVLGGIYRIRKIGATPISDPRGLRIGWSKLSVAELWELLSEERASVRRRASFELAKRGGSPRVKEFLLSNAEPRSSDARPMSNMTAAHVWTLAQIGTPESQQLVRDLLQHPDEHVRQVAINQVSLYRDAAASQQLAKILSHDAAPQRRLAAEALGRIGDHAVVPQLLAAAAAANDRVLRHSIAYALIEIADPDSTQAGLTADAPGTRSCALIVLDQMPGGRLQAAQVIQAMNDGDELLQQTAYWLLAHHPEWGGQLSEWLEQQLASLAKRPNSTTRLAIDKRLETLLVTFASQPEIQRLIASAANPDRPLIVRQLALRTMTRAQPEKTPAEWLVAVTGIINGADPDLLPRAIAAARQLAPTAPPDDELRQALIRTADTSALPTPWRVDALAAVSSDLTQLSDPHFSLLIHALSPEASISMRSAAADALSRAGLSEKQLEALCGSVRACGPLEIHRLLEPFSRARNDALGLKLLSSLRDSPALPSLRMDVVREKLATYGSAVQKEIDELHALVNVDIVAQRKKIDELLPQIRGGDVRRGQSIFNSSKAACSACHRIGYAGGAVGPDLTRIGETRTERDLLESIIFPNLSFVRSFESVVVITVDGRALSGLIRSETNGEIVLATGADQEVRLRREDVDEIHPGTVSVMPAGLDEALTIQELADLVAFLKNAKGS